MSEGLQWTACSGTPPTDANALAGLVSEVYQVTEELQPEPSEVKKEKNMYGYGRADDLESRKARDIHGFKFKVDCDTVGVLNGINMHSGETGREGTCAGVATRNPESTKEEPLKFSIKILGFLWHWLSRQCPKVVE